MPDEVKKIHWVPLRIVLMHVNVLVQNRSYPNFFDIFI